MSDALSLTTALSVSVLGMAWLALSMKAHWRQARGTDAPGAAMVLGLRMLGCGALLVSLLLCLRVDHPSMASLVWLMILTAASLAVAFTLSWRPRALAWLVAWS